MLELATASDTLSQDTAAQPRLEFPSPFTYIVSKPIPLVELRLRFFAREIHEKSHWWKKVHDEDIVARWKSEIVNFDREMVGRFWAVEERINLQEGYKEKQWPRDPITETQLNHLFDKLRYDAKQRDKKTGAMQTAIPMVYEASALIPARLKSAIRMLARELEDVPEDQKDWHPGSNKQVLDLVHPSLFSLRIGHSFIRNSFDGYPDVLRRLSEDEYFRCRPDIERRADAWNTQDFGTRLPFEFTVSKAFQWLPTDFEIRADGRIASKGYINNLQPVHYGEGYLTISSILERFIPMFERVLSDQLSPPPPSIVPIDPTMWYVGVEFPDDARSPSVELDEWMRRNHLPEIPEVLPFRPPGGEGRVPFNLKGRTIQVIVKMANIVLNPENPTYQGGSWHVEGMANEKIVATGLYYYDSDNITESKLMFRAAVGDGECNSAALLDYEQYDYYGYLVAYGVTNGLPLNQQLGHVIAQEDKCVVFPNIYQHRVARFELADPSRPGHRKILAFFLVDPLTPVHSTSVVPPQQAHWYRDAVYNAGAFRRLPTELVEVILAYASEGTITMEEAEQCREELMKERARFVVEHNEDIFEASFAMCEH
ncbi:hypothetical protein GY45DRAFT_1357087 [Cubamyces sp. BRFM 1775]|nr:hypothetical protein GY45DRAFT_1357087 [Cubamyces sp. BRFM 1775]